MMYVMMILSSIGGPMVIIAAIAAIVWFMGPHVGVTGVATRIWIIVAVAAAVLAVVGIRALIKWRRKKKIQAQLDAAAGIPAEDAAPKQDLSLDARLRRLIAAWRKEDPGLLQRPWYLVLGPAGAGRRSLLAAVGGLREAGDQFAAGEDGVREAEVWRGESAVFVCPDASYVDDIERRGAFGELLLALRRVVGALDGVVLTLDLPRLLDAGEDEVAATARTMRERYDHVAERFGSVFPVHLALTQCDQLHGFVDYFDHLGKADRADALGLLLPYAKDEPASTVAAFGERFDQLYQSLRLRRIPGLGGEAELAARERATRFPIQFLALRPRLELFVAELLGPRPTVETGILRGCFFTSTTQSGATRDRALGSWDPELVVGSGAHPIEVGDQRSYFARGLLGQVLPADGGLAYPREGDAARARRQVRGWAAVSLAAAALLVVAMGLSFVSNGRLLVAARAAAEGLHPQHVGAIATPALLSELEPLRLELERFEAWQRGEGPGEPWSLRWGLSQSDAAYAALRAGYFARARAEFIAPTAELIAADLDRSLDRGLNDNRQFALTFEQFYALSMLAGTLPASEELHLILLGEGEASKRPYWREAVFRNAGERQDDEVVAMAEEHLAYLATQARRQDEWAVALTAAQEAVHARALKNLRQADQWANFAYDRLNADITTNRGHTDMERPQRVIPAGTARAIFDYGPKDQAAPIKVYSQDYFDGIVQPAIERAAARLEQRFTALGEPVDAKRFRERFLELYAEKWSREWTKGLVKLRVRKAESMHEAHGRLAQIAGPGSPYLELLEAVAAGQVLHTADLGELNRPGYDPDGGWSDVLREQFQTLALALDTYIQQARGGKQLEKLEQLQAFATAAEAARATIVEALPEIADQPSRDAITDHIDAMILMAVVAVGDALAEDADRRWRVDIVQRFERDIADRFPFDTTAAASVSLDEYQAFFDPAAGAVSGLRTAVEACRAVTYQSSPIITLGPAYEDAMQRLAAMALVFAPGADGAPPTLPLRLRLTQHAGVEDIRFSIGEATAALYDRPDRRAELDWVLGEELVTRLAIRVERDRWLHLRFGQDPWGPLRVIAAAARGATADGVERDGGAVVASWAFPRTLAGSGSAAAAESAPTPAPQPAAPVAPAPEPASAPASHIETAVAPEVVRDPDPRVDNPPKRRAARGRTGMRTPDPEPVALTGYAGTAKTGGAIKLGPPASIEPAGAPELPPTRTRDVYRVDISFAASGIDPGLFTLTWLGDYAPPASIRSGTH